MIDTSEFCDLLMVDVAGVIHVVEAPAHEAHVGDYVKFTNGDVLSMGEVVDKMWCEKSSDTYRCIGYIKSIHPVEKIYHPRWEREDN